MGLGSRDMALSLLPCGGSSEFQGDTPRGITLMETSLACCYWVLVPSFGSQMS